MVDELSDEAQGEPVRSGICRIASRLASGAGRRVLLQVFAVYVAGNMMVCAIVFAPWALPRETVSGLMGRWRETESGWRARVGRVGAWLVDRLYFWEPNHCAEIYRIEMRAREILYP